MKVGLSYLKGGTHASKQIIKEQDARNEREKEMKKMSKPMGHSLPIVGGVQMGHHVNPKNHASKGVLTDMPIATNMPKIFARRMSAKRPAIKALQGK